MQKVAIVNEGVVHLLINNDLRALLIGAELRLILQPHHTASRQGEIMHPLTKRAIMRGCVRAVG